LGSLDAKANVGKGAQASARAKKKTVSNHERGWAIAEQGKS